MIHNTSIKYFMIFAITHLPAMRPGRGGLKPEPGDLQIPSHGKTKPGSCSLKAVRGVSQRKEAAVEEYKSADHNAQTDKEKKPE